VAARRGPKGDQLGDRYLYGVSRIGTPFRLHRRQLRPETCWPGNGGCVRKGELRHDLGAWPCPA
jgi:hypothetical protein